MKIINNWLLFFFFWGGGGGGEGCEKSTMVL